MIGSGNNNFGLNMAKKVLIPMITPILENPATKDKIVTFLEGYKNKIELDENEDDIVLICESDNQGLYFSIYTIETLISGVELRRRIHRMTFEQLASIVLDILKKQ